MPRVKLFDEQVVLTKAMELFWKQGFSATSIQDLVSHLGINRASLYTTFGDKEELFTKAFAQYHASNMKRIQLFFQCEPVVIVGIRKLFELSIEESANDVERKGCFAVNTTTELVPGDSLITQKLLANKIAFEAQFYDYLRRGADQGQFESPHDLKAIASLLYTFYSGLKVVTKVDPRNLALLQSVDVVLSLLDSAKS